MQHIRYSQEGWTRIAKYTAIVPILILISLYIRIGEKEGPINGAKTSQIYRPVKRQAPPQELELMIPKVTDIGIIPVKPQKKPRETRKKPTIILVRTEEIEMEVKKNILSARGVRLPQGDAATAILGGDSIFYVNGVEKQVGGGSGTATFADVGEEMDGGVTVTQDTEPVLIAVLYHTFTNYHQHQDTLTEFTNWLNKNTPFRQSGTVPMLSPSDERFGEVDVLFITGDDVEYAKKYGALRQGWPTAWSTTSFSDKEREALRTFVENGGTIFFNYGGGKGKNRDFSQTMRYELEEKIFKKELQEIIPDVPYLQGIKLNGRLAVIFSEEDILSQKPWIFLTNLVYYAY